MVTIGVVIKMTSDTNIQQANNVKLEEIEAIRLRKKLSSGSMYDLLNSDIPPTSFIIDKVLPKSQILTIFGKGGHFKSSICLYFALCITTGKHTFFFNVNKKQNVLWLDEEMGIEGLKTKVAMLAKGLSIDIEDLKETFFYHSIKGIKLDNKDTIVFIKSEIAKNSIGVVFVDSLSKCMDGDEDRSKDMRYVHENIRRVIAETGTSFVTIHHSTKYGDGDTIESLRGSGDLANQVDRAISMRCVGDNKYKFALCKQRYGDGFKAININVNDIGKNTVMLSYAGTASENVNKAKVNNGILDLFKQEKQLKRDKIVKKLEKGYSNSAIDKALKQLVFDGILIKTKYGLYELKRGKYERWKYIRN